MLWHCVATVVQQRFVAVTVSKTSYVFWDTRRNGRFGLCVKWKEQSQRNIKQHYQPNLAGFLDRLVSLKQYLSCLKVNPFPLDLTNFTELHLSVVAQPNYRSEDTIWILGLSPVGLANNTPKRMALPCVSDQHCNLRSAQILNISRWTRQLLDPNQQTPDQQWRTFFHSPLPAHLNSTKNVIDRCDRVVTLQRHDERPEIGIRDV